MNSLFSQISEASRPTEDKIEAMMNYKSYWFRKPVSIGVYLLYYNHKEIKAPDEETARLYAGSEWELIS
jgi:hypothetical protein